MDIRWKEKKRERGLNKERKKDRERGKGRQGTACSQDVAAVSCQCMLVAYELQSIYPPLSLTLSPSLSLSLSPPSLSLARCLPHALSCQMSCAHPRPADPSCPEKETIKQWEGET